MNLSPCSCGDERTESQDFAADRLRLLLQSTDLRRFAKAAGKAKMAQMQLAKMQREMAETEKKLGKARANRERLAQVTIAI